MFLNMRCARLKGAHYIAPIGNAPQRAPLVALKGCARLGGTLLLMCALLEMGCTFLEGIRSLIRALQPKGLLLGACLLARFWI